MISTLLSYYRPAWVHMARWSNNETLELEVWNELRFCTATAGRACNWYRTLLVAVSVHCWLNIVII